MKRTLFSVMLILGLFINPAMGAAAQPVETESVFVSEVTGDEIDIGTSGQIVWVPEDYSLSASRSFQEEYIWFSYNSSNFQLVIIDGNTSAQDYLDITMQNMLDFYESFEVLGEEVTDDSAFFIAEAVYQGSPLVVYYEYEADALGDVDTVVMQFASHDFFQSDMEMIQSEVTLAGEPLLDDTDAAELSALIGFETTSTRDDGGATGRTTRGGSDDSTGDDTDNDSETTGRTTRGGSDNSTGDDADDDSGTTGRTTRGGSDNSTGDDADDDSGTTGRTTRGSSNDSTGDDADDTGTDEEGGDRDTRSGRVGTSLTNVGNDDTDTDDEEASPSAGGADWSELGLISDSEWESPTYGNVVTWDSTWEFAVDYEWAIVVSDDPPYDIITLQTVDGLGYVYVTVDQPYESTPQSLVDYWMSDEYQDGFQAEIEVVETGTTSNTATFIYNTENSRGETLTVVLEGTFLDDGQIIFSQISAAPETIHLVYEQYIDGVEVDGATLDTTFSADEIQEITGN